MVTVKSKQAFKGSVFSGEEEIRVEDPKLAKWLVAIHGMKQAAWAASIVLVGAGIYASLASGGAAAPAAAAADAAAVGIAGLTAGGLGAGASAVGAMIGLGLALGGAAGLVTVRSKYKIAEKGDGYVVLRKKNLQSAPREPTSA